MEYSFNTHRASVCSTVHCEDILYKQCYIYVKSCRYVVYCCRDCVCECVMEWVWGRYEDNGVWVALQCAAVFLSLTLFTASSSVLPYASTHRSSRGHSHRGFVARSWTYSHWKHKSQKEQCFDFTGLKCSFILCMGFWDWVWFTTVKVFLFINGKLFYIDSFYHM